MSSGIKKSIIFVGCCSLLLAMKLKALEASFESGDPDVTEGTEKKPEEQTEEEQRQEEERQREERLQRQQQTEQPEQKTKTGQPTSGKEQEEFTQTGMEGKQQEKTQEQKITEQAEELKKEAEQSFVPATSEPESGLAWINELSDALAENRPFTRGRAIDTLKDNISKEVDQLNETIESDKSLEEKTQSIEEMRKKLNELRDELNKQSDALEEGQTALKQALERLKTSIEEQNRRLDDMSLLAHEKEKGFFKKIVRNIKSWFDRNFDFHKTDAIIERSISAEKDIFDKLIDQEKFFGKIENKIKNLSNLDIGNKTLGMSYLYSELADNMRIWDKIPDEAVDVGENLQEAINSLDQKAQLYKGDKATLFEKLRADFSQTLGDISPDEVYKKLGFEGKEPRKITRDELQEKIKELQNQPKSLTDEQQLIQFTEKQLSNPVAKEIYDKFLDDVDLLKNMNIDPMQEQFSQKVNEHLNKHGNLATIEISESDHKKLQELKNSVTAKNDAYKGKTLDFANLKKRFGKTIHQAITEVEKERAGKDLKDEPFHNFASFVESDDELKKMHGRLVAETTIKK